MDDVHDMMDDISEQNEIAEEISSALSTPIGFNQEIDDVRRSRAEFHLGEGRGIRPPLEIWLAIFSKG